ncbi:hypothetical protein COBT_003552, partial [Conglomerata obtusa]
RTVCKENLQQYNESRNISRVISEDISSKPSYTKTTTNQDNKIDSFHGITLRNKFAEMVNPYIDNFKKITEKNIKNLEFFAKNTVFAISFESTSDKKINFMTKLIEKLILKCENSSNVKS